MAVLIRTTTRKSQFEVSRRLLKDRYGDKYGSRVSPFRTVMIKFCRAHVGMDPIECAVEFVNHLQARGKWSAHVQACVYAATLDAMDEGVI